MSSDVEFLLKALADGEEHELGEIMQRSIDERGHGLTIHSRASDLRKAGYKVKNRTKRLPSGRTSSHYQLLGLKDAPPAVTTPSPGGASSSPARTGGDAERLGPDGVSSSPSDDGEPLNLLEDMKRSWPGLFEEAA